MENNENITIKLNVEVIANGASIEQVTADFKKEISKYFISKDEVANIVDKRLIHIVTGIESNQSK